MPFIDHKHRPDPMSSLYAIAFAVVMLVVASPAAALEGSDLLGRVVGVTDGDTITVLDGQNRQHVIRLEAALWHHREADLPPLKWSSEYHRMAIEEEAGDAQETAFDRGDHRQAS